jgi:hypothetical protein
MLLTSRRDHKTLNGATRATIERTLAPKKRNQKSEVRVRKVSGPGWFVGAGNILSIFFHAFFTGGLPGPNIYTVCKAINWPPDIFVGRPCETLGPDLPPDPERARFGPLGTMRGRYVGR